MNNIRPLDQARSIVASVLNQTAKVRKIFKDFFIETMFLILTIYGKLNFLSMSRHGDSFSPFRHFRSEAGDAHRTLAEGRRLPVASVKKVFHNATLYQHIRKLFEGRESEDPHNNQALSDDIPPNLLFFGVRDSA